MTEFRYGRAYGLFLATLIGLAALAALYFAEIWASYGYGLLLGVPLLIGSAIGYAFNFLRASAVAAILCGIVLLATLALTFQFAGMLCVTSLALIFVLPFAFGLVAGAGLRQLGRTREQRSAKKAAITSLLALAPLAPLYLESKMEFEGGVEVVATQRVLELPADVVWDSILFYEEVRDKPPLLARIGLPRPLRTEGSSSRVGDLTRCVYDTGYLLKRIVESKASERLAFEVIEQRGIEDRSIELIDGSFDLESLGPSRTRLTLTTRYRPLLQGRLVWLPFESALTRALHSHVIDEMARRQLPAADQDYWVRRGGR